MKTTRSVSPKTETNPTVPPTVGASDIDWDMLDLAASGESPWESEEGTRNLINIIARCFVALTKARINGERPKGFTAKHVSDYIDDPVNEIKAAGSNVHNVRTFLRDHPKWYPAAGTVGAGKGYFRIDANAIRESFLSDTDSK